jgi:hypothetical protein
MMTAAPEDGGIYIISMINNYPAARAYLVWLRGASR